mmetsp:Transcript_5565/g.12678  ORF Transcript_5565/g.12678 Transcript_5565/m.12678 type:complete len:381 (-) Transcript_5565:129-1271(-)
MASVRLRRGVVIAFLTSFFMWPNAKTEMQTNGSEELLPLLEKSRPCNKVSLLPNGWCMDDEMMPRYVGENSEQSTDVQLYTHEGYNKCLANKTVVFIGDSRVRYQYMHLAGYLKSKQFMKCDDQSPYHPENTSNDPECYLIDYESHGGRDWFTWYKESLTMLTDLNNNASSTAEAQQDSLCDCFRGGGPTGSYENRYTRRRTQYGEINLIYLQSSTGTVFVNQEFPPFNSFDSTSPTRCMPGECSPQNRNNTFTGDVKAALWDILPRLNATHAFINLGWKHKFPFRAQSEFTCVMKEYMQAHPNIKLHLMSHPPKSLDIPNPLKDFDANNLKCGDDVGVLDRSIVNEDVPIFWYWDSMHVLSILNEEYNHQLIKKICPIV